MRKDMQVEKEDFKYIIQDMTNLYIGPGYSYGELMELDQVPFKLKAILSHYMLREVASDTRIEDHLFYLEPSSLSYMVYQQMKVKFRLAVWEEGKKGRPGGYRSRTYRIEEIVNNTALIEQKDFIIVEELHITKLALIGVSI